jgi:hypothetical protein
MKELVGAFFSTVILFFLQPQAHNMRVYMKELVCAFLSTVICSCCNHKRTTCVFTRKNLYVPANDLVLEPCVEADV